MSQRTPIPFELLYKPATRALTTNGYQTLQQLAKKTEKEIADIHGIGPTTIVILKKEFKKHGLTFKKAK